MIFGRRVVQKFPIRWSYLWHLLHAGADEVQQTRVVGADGPMTWRAKGKEQSKVYEQKGCQIDKEVCLRKKLQKNNAKPRLIALKFTN